MRKLATIFSLGLLILTFAVISHAQEQITGDYIESRSADVYVAQCFANGEVGLAGDEATLAWHIRSGSWNGQKLDGLTVMASVKAQATLGDPFGSPYPAKAVVLVDEKAAPEQRDALVSFAKHMGGDLLAHVSRVIPTSIDMQVLHDAQDHGRATLRAGSFAAIVTRPINEKDHICGNETTFYPPLTQLTHSMPAVALTDEYHGPDLGVDWELHDKRSAFVGTFAQ
jgi:hypothetical protein